MNEETRIKETQERIIKMKKSNNFSNTLIILLLIIFLAVMSVLIYLYFI